jgi:broad-specificity NMP kinase
MAYIAPSAKCEGVVEIKLHENWKAATAKCEGVVEIKLHENWKAATAYIELSPEQAKMFAEEILEIVDDMKGR